MKPLQARRQSFVLISPSSSPQSPTRPIDKGHRQNTSPLCEPNDHNRVAYMRTAGVLRAQEKRRNSLCTTPTRATALRRSQPVRPPQPCNVIPSLRLNAFQRRARPLSLVTPFCGSTATGARREIIQHQVGCRR